MILRILRGRAARSDLPALLAAVRGDVTEWASIDDGLVAVQPAFRDAADGIEFLLVSSWKTAESVLARGGEVTLPRGRLGASGLLQDARAGHYELLLDRTVAGDRTGRILRVSSMALTPGVATGFYERVRGLWDDLVGDAGLQATWVGRRIGPETEQAVVISLWDSRASIDAATNGGFVGGDEMAAFYATAPVIEHFTALDLDA